MLRKTYNSYLFVYKIQQRFCPIFINLIFLVLYYFAFDFTINESNSSFGFDNIFPHNTAL